MQFFQEKHGAAEKWTSFLGMKDKQDINIGGVMYFKIIEEEGSYQY